MLLMVLLFSLEHVTGDQAETAGCIVAILLALGAMAILKGRLKRHDC